MKIDIQRAIELLADTGYECDEIQTLKEQLEAANALIRTYRAESTQLATLYPFPKNLESPEFRLLFEIGEMMRKLGNLTHAERLHALALRLQAEWLVAVGIKA